MIKQRRGDAERGKGREKLKSDVLGVETLGKNVEQRREKPAARD
jgi:hypothetical protein